MNKIRAVITGVDGYVPDYVLTNAELETLVDTSDEWIVSRTGVKERRILKGEGKGTSIMAIKAVNGLLKKTNTDPKDIDLVICATVTPDMLFPATANIISDEIGAVNAFGYDIMAACSGFICALTTGVQFIETGKYKKIVIIGADKMSTIINYKDRKTCIIFGDGAGAVMLEQGTDGSGIIDSILKSDGSGAKYLYIEGGGSRMPATLKSVQEDKHYTVQKGSVVFKFAVNSMANIVEEIMERNNLKGNDLAYLVPHQANKRIISATANRMNISEDKVMINIQKYGNTTAATIPLCLWDYEKKLKKGDNIILVAFGGGFTWGSIYIKWAYNMD